MTSFTPRMPFFQLLCLVLVIFIQPSDGKALRSVQKNINSYGGISDSADTASSFFVINQIEMKNTCPNSNLNIHLRYYDGGNVKYSIANNVHMNQNINVATDAKVILVLVAAETARDGIDIFHEKCLIDDRNFLRADDGLCYKLYYSSDDLTLSCDENEVFSSRGGSQNNGLRRLSSVRPATVTNVVEQTPR